MAEPYTPAAQETGVKARVQRFGGYLAGTMIGFRLFLGDPAVSGRVGAPRRGGRIDGVVGG